MLRIPARVRDFKQIGMDPMSDYLFALGFVAIVVTPSIIAAFCASERRMLQRNIPAVERRDRR